MIGVLLAGALGACTGEDHGRRPRIGAVARTDVSAMVEAPGTASGRATAVLRAPADGTVERLYVTDGDHVRAGAALAKISSPDAEQRLARAREADRVAAGGAPVPAGIDLTELQRRTDQTARDGFAQARLAAQSITDPQQRALVLTGITRAETEYRTAADAARAAVTRMNAGLGTLDTTISSITAAQRVQTRAALDAAERTVRALTIKAPFDGVIGLGGPAGSAPGLSGLADRLPRPLQSRGGLAGFGSLGAVGGEDGAPIATGSPVSAGDAVITVTDVSTLSLGADVDETDVLQVREGMQANVAFDAVPSGTYTAKVTSVGSTPKEANEGGVTYKVTLALSPGTLADGAAAPWPKPGMSATVSLHVRDVHGVLSVPSAAVVSSGREPVVWVVSGGRAQRRVVGLGVRGDATVEITRGLREGERIVVHGADSVEQGQELP
ncbi:efflux RND transporter periplasmic adaptor subunit [Actinomadura macra]|uniref:efflux RND transporter periplasmic adaptor subunit n=1 Tax=Actinomadura macra TaxID=46164 RepID=UPI000A7EE89D|nr:HlyD family efflux transporter periplasmic adaptor subunit [Actinomadura macra]